MKTAGFCLAGQKCEKSKIFYPSISDRCSSPLHLLCTTLAKFGHIFFDTYMNLYTQLLSSSDD